MTIKLTPRQRQVVLLKTRGAANKEIAQVLGISEETVKSFIRNINQECATHGVDLWALPTNRQERMKALHGLIQLQKASDNFGETAQ